MTVWRPGHNKQVRGCPLSRMAIPFMIELIYYSSSGSCGQIRTGTKYVLSRWDCIHTYASADPDLCQNPVVKSEPGSGIYHYDGIIFTLTHPQIQLPIGHRRPLLKPWRLCRHTIKHQVRVSASTYQPRLSCSNIFGRSRLLSSSQNRAKSRN